MSNHELNIPVENPYVGAIGGWENQPINHRVKGFYNHVVTPGVLGQFREYLTQGLKLYQETGETRIIGRGVVDNRLLEAADFSPFKLEAAIPLADQWEGASFCYFGHVDPKRQLTSGLEQQVAGLVEIARNESWGSRWQRPLNLPPGLELVTLINNHTDYQRLAQLFTYCFSSYVTSLDQESLRQAYQTPTTLGFAIKNEEADFIATISAEIAEIPMKEGNIFKIAELSDYATHPDYRRHGLNTFLRAHLLKYLCDFNHFDVFLSESNALSPGSNYHNVALGLEYCGLQPMHCLLEADSASETISRDLLPEGYRQYAPLVVWAANAQTIRKVIANQQR